jgi:DNA-binding NarL/FixJ family response regulator
VRSSETSIPEVGVITVDDQAVFREAARALVAATAGFTLLGEAACGEDAVTLAARLHPDLMLVDLGLPDISGFETSARLARLRPRPFVVLVSTREDPVLSDLAGSHGALGFLPKRALRPKTLRALWQLRDGSEAWIASHSPPPARTLAETLGA